ncbi:MAG: hypothetical protein GW911_07525 [Armatimonadetes bacterium]|nr:hypothetical protein [Armatimonadota bacterium]NCO90380.1 hypothetical protein [Armatimonadota bacterium]NCP30119.1 hypothetical protein [Armatimonadota bacterium]NCQ31340.1 hypothetical protein [Armatimonadota bacterium]NDK11887.1 hypothetical protein [Armatimonadota bacterium]
MARAAQRWQPTHPPHVLLDDSWYMISTRTWRRTPHLGQPHRRDEFLQKVSALCSEFQYHLYTWAVLFDHYHLILKTRVGASLPTFMRRLHAGLATGFNREDGAAGRKVWHNYWDTCVRSEADFWTRVNYVHYNPVKHGYAPSMAEWQHSGYSRLLKANGKEWMADLCERHPTANFVLRGDEFDDS